MSQQDRMIIAISGASGFVIGYRLLQLLRLTDVETHLIISDSAKITMKYETELVLANVTELADRVHSNNDIAACLSSGSYRTLGMVVAPCSMKSLAEIANGAAASLLSRAADVVLKERRRLVLVTRETPLNLIHIRNMQAATEAGAVIYPPVPAFYSNPKSIDDLVEHSAARILDLFDIPPLAIRRWGEDLGKKPRSRH